MRSKGSISDHNNSRVTNSMTTVCFNNMTLVPVDEKHDKNDLLYNYFPPKLSHEEFIGPVTRYHGRRSTFQRAMKLTIVMGQCFGLNPVLGVCENDASKLRFTFCSGRCLYSILTILGQSWLICMSSLRLFTDTDFSIASNTSLVFYGTNCVTTIMFLRVATKWPHLCQYIAMIEASDPNSDNSIVKKCNVSCIAVLCLAFVEHMLANLSGIAIAKDCQPDVELYQAFLLQAFPVVWSVLNYNAVIGFLAQVFNTQCTFNWNFADVFVICISMYLTARLQQINDRIIALKGKYVPASFWRTMREDYCRTTNLVRKVDDVISGVVFISFANNLFFICVQLLHILAEGVKVIPACGKNPADRPLKGFEQAIYFVYSFVFLMARSLAVSLIAARVHSASLVPAHALYDVPSASYCVEVQRFLDQVHSDTVALSGLQFFNVKRGLVLAVAGTIVTYELVLMQFTGVSPTTTTPTL